MSRKKPIPFNQQPIQLNAFEAQQLGRKGMEQAGDSADYRIPGWQDTAYAFFLTWLYQQPDKHRFMLEDVRLAAQKAGTVPEPPDNRAWGNIAVKAKKDKLIKTGGYGPCSSTIGHGHPVTIWQKI